MVIIVALLALIVLIVYWSLKVDCDFTLAIRERLGIDLYDLKGRIVWITGASSGIGAELAVQLAAARAKIVLSARNETGLNAVRDRCYSAGHVATDDVLVVPLDITDQSAHQAALDKVTGHFGKVDVLVNNAGRALVSKFVDITSEQDQSLFATNLLGPIGLTRLVVKHWLSKSHRGQLVVVSSLSGRITAPMNATYAGTKHALHGYFDALRNEVNSV